MDLKLRAEFELAAVIGDIGTTQDFTTSTGQSTAKEFMGFGGVLQLEVEHGANSYQVETGFATGDDVVFGASGPSYIAPDCGSRRDGGKHRGTCRAPRCGGSSSVGAPEQGAGAPEPGCAPRSAASPPSEDLSQQKQLS